MNVTTWLSMWDVVGDESRMQVVLGLVFLGVCILNTLGLMLAKFLSAAPIAGLRRALGANRMDIVRQHLIEVMVVGILGGAAGLVLTLGGLAELKGWLYSDMLVGSDNIVPGGNQQPIDHHRRKQQRQVQQREFVQFPRRLRPIAQRRPVARSGARIASSQDHARAS